MMRHHISVVTIGVVMVIIGGYLFVARSQRRRLFASAQVPDPESPINETPTASLPVL